MNVVLVNILISNSHNYSVKNIIRKLRFLIIMYAYLKRTLIFINCNEHDVITLIKLNI